MLNTGDKQYIVDMDKQYIPEINNVHVYILEINLTVSQKTENGFIHLIVILSGQNCSLGDKVFMASIYGVGNKQMAVI